MLNFTTQQTRYLEQKEAFLDQFIDQEDEHNLFISSYIHGHFSVVMAKLSAAIASQQNTYENNLHGFEHEFQSLLYHDIQQAIANKELSDEDADAVSNMLGVMFSQ